MATRFSGWFEAAKTSGGCGYTPSARTERVPMFSPGWSRWFLGLIVALIMAGMGMLGHYVSITLRSGWDVEHAIFAPVSLMFLIAGRRRTQSSSSDNEPVATN